MAQGKRLKIIWTETAEKQLFLILEYWTVRNKSPRYARKLIALITERTDQIAKTPFSYKKVNFPKTRVAIMGHFSLYYQVKETFVLVTAFWDNRQNPKTLFKQLQESYKT